MTDTFGQGRNSTKLFYSLFFVLAVFLVSCSQSTSTDTNVEEEMDAICRKEAAETDAMYPSQPANIPNNTWRWLWCDTYRNSFTSVSGRLQGYTEELADYCLSKMRYCN